MSRAGVTWLDRCLLQGPRVAVVTSQRQFVAAMKGLGVADPDPFCDPAWHACVHAFEVDGDLVCVTGLNLPALARLGDGIDVAGVLAHEAVHVWQRIRDRLGPGDLGREMEAYAIQNIAVQLMRAYVSATASSTGLAHAA